MFKCIDEVLSYDGLKDFYLLVCNMNRKTNIACCKISKLGVKELVDKGVIRVVGKDEYIVNPDYINSGGKFRSAIDDKWSFYE